METSLTYKLETTISGEYYKDLEFNPSVSITIKSGVTYTGPGENSPYNSREFRVKFYAQKYEWTQEKYLMPQNQLMGTKTGTAIEAVKCAEYSIDSKQ